MCGGAAAALPKALGEAEEKEGVSYSSKRWSFFMYYNKAPLLQNPMDLGMLFNSSHFAIAVNSLWL